MRALARLAGLVAAAVALAVTELPSAFAGGPSLVATVGNRFIDGAAGSLRGPAVAVFGANDKPALIVGIVVVALLIGAMLGVATLRYRFVGVVGFAVFAVVGVAAAAADEQASLAGAVVGAGLGFAAATVTLYGLLQLIAARPSEPAVAAAVAIPNPAVHGGSRRQFFAWAGGAGAAAVAGTAGARLARSSTSVANERASVVLREPLSRRAVPEQPFTTAGLSEYVTPSAEFYRIDTALFVPQVKTDRWQLSLTGAIERPFSLTYDELLAMDMIEEVVTLSCVSNEIGGDLVGNARWLGVPLRALLERAGVKRGGEQIVGRSVDGFTAGFPTSVALDGRTALVAVGMNGEPLPVIHGFPARLVVAGLYGYVSATKWLKEIQITDSGFNGYWIPRGWSKNGPVKTMSRIDTPAASRTLSVGRVPVAGVAWAPTRGISTVEVQIDNGPWAGAQLGRVASAETWVQWLYPWDATAGTHTIKVRATDGTGETQTAKVASVDPDGATGHHTITVNVR